jgi:hypothetical protein
VRASVQMSDAITAVLYFKTLVGGGSKDIDIRDHNNHKRKFGIYST